MFRGIVFSIVLTVVANPSATLLCTDWCQPTQDQAAPSSGCHPRPSAAVVIRPSDDACDSRALGPVAWLRDEVRRPTSAPEWDQAVLGPHHRFAKSAGNLDQSDITPAAARTLAQPPLSALRI